MTLSVRPLCPETWEPYARFVEAHDGVWGGCWCIGFHTRNFVSPAANRALKRKMVDEGTTHAALVFDGDEVVGWAQYGSPAELPAIKNLKVYQAGLAKLPDWRITCLFSGKGHRGKGVAEAGVRGALDLIAAAGGGTVEAYPEETEGRKVSGSFLWNGTLGMFERLGFVRDRQIGKHKWVVRRAI
ncbi:MAG: GNAT family N-acetyltransferase [Rhodobacteraceae bacterium]|jgi:hypothetical protein|nr:GNAT family N-acetyltransferase [Paracoccaceae bacterium]